MARVTVEDCLKLIDNRFMLVHAAVKRARQLMKGARVTIEETKNRDIVLALREIAANKVMISFPQEKDVSPPVMSEITEIKEVTEEAEAEELQPLVEEEEGTADEQDEKGKGKKEIKSKKKGK